MRADKNGNGFERIDLSFEDYIRGIGPRGNGYAGSGAQPQKTFNLVMLDNIQTQDEPNALIEGLLPAGPGLHMVFGAPKSLKSFLLMHAYIHIAAGIDYAGRHVAQGAAVYITSEGIRGVNHRLIAMRRHLNVEGDGIPFYLVSVMPNLGTGEGDTVSLIASIKAVVPKGIEVVAVAIDTLRRATPGKDEKDSKDMGVLVENCGRIAKEFSCIVSLVHHSPRSDDTRVSGSNLLDGSIDAGWSVVRNEGQKQSTVTLSIAKDLEDGIEWQFSLTEAFEIGTTRYGMPIRSCAVEIEAKAGEAGTERPAGKKVWGKSLKIFRDAFLETLDQRGSHITPYADGPTVKAIDKEWMRDEFYKRYPADGETAEVRQKTRRQAFRRAIIDAVEKDLAGTIEREGATWLWII